LTFAAAADVRTGAGVRVGVALALAAGETLPAGVTLPHPVTLPMTMSSTVKAARMIPVNLRGFFTGDPLLGLHCPHAAHSKMTRSEAPRMTPLPPASRMPANIRANRACKLGRRHHSATMAI
jgi:hypothetical protein